MFRRLLAACVLPGALYLLFTGLFCSPALASTSLTYHVSIDAIASAGHSSTSATYSVRDIAGQACAIGSSTSGTYSVFHGFLSLEGGKYLSDATDSAGFLVASDGRGVAWGDYDVDGSLDLYVSRGTTGTNDLLFRNNGNGTFTSKGGAVGIRESQTGRGAGWADIDADGRLDVYVRNAESDVGILWQNLGTAGFTNRAQAAGLADATVGVAASWGDYDGDGLPDLFMAGTNGAAPHLYRNKGGGLFERTDASMGLTQPTWGSGTRGDFDNDGWLDLYVVNTGTNRDALWMNCGADAGAGVPPAFSNVTAAAGITDSHDGRSAVWCDFNGDGFLDIYVANCGESGQPNLVYFNNDAGAFTRVVSGEAKRSYGAACGDFDGDGDPDLVVTRLDAPISLYRNDSAAHWLRIRPVSEEGCQTAYGAQVRLYAAGTTNLVAMRQVDGGHATGCQDAYDLSFGVPAGTNRYDIEVRFPFRGDPGNTGTNASVVIDKSINAELGNVLPADVGSGAIEIRGRSGRVYVTRGVLFVSGGDAWLLQNSGAARRLTASGGDRPCSSPDGAKLVFTSTRNGNYDIFMELTTGGADQPFMTNAWNETAPAWAPDNSAIAYVSDQNTNLDIYVVDTAGAGARNLTENPANDFDPAWSPTGPKIVFASDRGTGTNIWVMDCDGANPTNLTRHASVNLEPSWSPDGLHIAFASYRDGNAEVHVMNFDGTSPINLTTNAACDRHPTWNEDGAEVIFESDRDGTARLYACAPDGSGLRVLTDTMEGRRPRYTHAYRYPPKSVVFGEKNGRITYWADPVNTEGGNFTIAETDFILPGRGRPIRFMRFYNSQDPFDGEMGFGWRHSYLVSLNRELNDHVTITWGDGHQDIFWPFGSNAYSHVFGSTPGSLTPAGGGWLSFTEPDRTAYLLDTNGLLISVTDRNSNSVTYAYNPNNMLAMVIDPRGGQTMYAYDDSDRLVAVRTRLNATDWATGSNQYDHVGHLIRRIDPRGYSASYAYDANGNLLAGAVSGGLSHTNRYALDVNRGLVSVLTENDTANNEQAYYVYGLGLISRITPSDDVRTYHYDQIGGTLALSDKTGTVTDAYAYDPFGKVLGSSGTTMQRYRFVGKLGAGDDGYGLLYMRARYYDTGAGQFVGIDPVVRRAVRPSRLSPYVYAADSPLLWTDPSGESAEWLGGAVEGLVDFMAGEALGAVSEDAGDAFTIASGTYSTAVVLGGASPIGALVGQGLGFIKGYYNGYTYNVSELQFEGDAASIFEGGEVLGATLGVLQRRFDDWRWDLVQSVGARFRPQGESDSSATSTGGSVAGATQPPSSAVNQRSAASIQYTWHGKVTPTTPTAPAQPTRTLSPEHLAYQAAHKAQIRAENQYSSWSKSAFSQYEAIQNQMQASIDSLTRGQGWESMSGQHGLQYSTATKSYHGSDVSFTYLSGYWYWNVSRCVELANPAPTFSTWLAAHAAQRSAVENRLIANYTANGINTPWIPEVYEAYAIDGKFAVYGK